MSEEELVLESIGSWSSELLKQQLRSGKISRNVDPAEVAAAAAESVVRIIYIHEKNLVFDACRVFNFAGGTRAQIPLPLQLGPDGAQVAHGALQEAAGLPDVQVGVPVR